MSAQAADQSAAKEQKADPYTVLGIEKSATVDEIKKAYRKKALQLHPDKTGGTTTEAFKAVQEANAILSDPEKRKLYDTFGHNGIRMTDEMGLDPAFIEMLTMALKLMGFLFVALALSLLCYSLFFIFATIKIDWQKNAEAEGWSWDGFVFVPLYIAEIPKILMTGVVIYLSLLHLKDGCKKWRSAERRNNNNVSSRGDGSAGGGSPIFSSSSAGATTTASTLGDIDDDDCPQPLPQTAAVDIDPPTTPEGDDDATANKKKWGPSAAKSLITIGVCTALLLQTWGIVCLGMTLGSYETLSVLFRRVGGKQDDDAFNAALASFNSWESALISTLTSAVILYILCSLFWLNPKSVERFLNRERKRKMKEFGNGGRPHIGPDTDESSSSASSGDDDSDAELMTKSQSGDGGGGVSASTARVNIPPAAAAAAAGQYASSLYDHCSNISVGGAATATTAQPRSRGGSATPNDPSSAPMQGPSSTAARGDASRNTTTNAFNTKRKMKRKRTSPVTRAMKKAFSLKFASPHAAQSYWHAVLPTVMLYACWLAFIALLSHQLSAISVSAAMSTSSATVGDGVLVHVMSPSKNELFMSYHIVFLPLYIAALRSPVWGYLSGRYEHILQKTLSPFTFGVFVNPDANTPIISSLMAAEAKMSGKQLIVSLILRFLTVFGVARLLEADRLGLGSEYNFIFGAPSAKAAFIVPLLLSIVLIPISLAVLCGGAFFMTSKGRTVLEGLTKQAMESNGSPFR